MMHYFGKVCNKHPALMGKRYLSDRSCPGCKADKQAAWRNANPEKEKAQKAEYLPKWRIKNAEKIRNDARIRMREWRKTNHEKVKADANSAEPRAYRAARRARKKNATPVWANDFFIREIYDLAILRSKMTGIKWHVDHRVPLQSDMVCGLHCEQNLNVILGKENIAKGNRHWPNM